MTEHPDSPVRTEVTAGAGTQAGTASVTDAGTQGGEKQKRPARPAPEIRADIVKERAELGASFEALRDDLDEAVDSGRQKLAEVGRKAKVVAPAVGAALAVVLFLRSRARDKRQSRRGDR